MADAVHDFPADGAPPVEHPMRDSPATTVDAPPPAADARLRTHSVYVPAIAVSPVYRGGGVMKSPEQLLYDLPTSLEFLFQEDAHRNSPSWGEQLTFYTGLGCVGGAAAGASVGFVRALREAESGESAKLRLNRVLNQVGSVGKSSGNRLGMYGFLFAGIGSAVCALRDGEDDWMNTVAGGLGAGALYKIGAGPRAAAIHGAVGALLAGAALVFKPLPLLETFAPRLADKLQYIR